MSALEHLDAGLQRLLDGVEEDVGQELGQRYARLGSHQLVGGHLAQRVSGLFSRLLIARACKDAHQAKHAVYNKDNCIEFMCTIKNA